MKRARGWKAVFPAAASCLLAGATSAQIRLNGPLARGPLNSLGTSRLAPDGSRVVYLVNPGEGFELLGVPFDGSQTPVRLDAASGVPRESVRSFAISPDSGHVAYVANKNLTARQELFSVSIAGGPARRLSAALVDGATVQEDLAFTPDSSRVVYRADAFQDERFELFSVPVTGGARVKLNPPIAGAGQNVSATFAISPDGSRPPFSLSSLPGLTIPVSAFRVVPDGRGVVYTAIRDFASATELFLRPLVRHPRDAATPTRTVFRTH